MMKREELQNEIEQARTELNRALEEGKSMDEFYGLSVKLDKLIEDYIDLCELEGA